MSAFFLVLSLLAVSSHSASVPDPQYADILANAALVREILSGKSCNFMFTETGWTKNICVKSEKNRQGSLDMGFVITVIVIFIIF